MVPHGYLSDDEGVPDEEVSNVTKNRLTGYLSTNRSEK